MIFKTVSTTMNIELDLASEAKLSRLAVERAQTVEQLIQEAIRDYVEEWEDGMESDAAYQRYLRGEEDAVSLDEAERQLGLES